MRCESLWKQLSWNQSFSPNFRPGTGRTAAEAEQEFLSSSRTEAASAPPTAAAGQGQGQGHSAKSTWGMGIRRMQSQNIHPGSVLSAGTKQGCQNTLKYIQMWFYHPQCCHTTINSGRLQSLWNTWFITHDFFELHHFFTISLWNASFLNTYCFPGVGKNWNVKFITDPSNQRSQDLCF